MQIRLTRSQSRAFDAGVPDGYDTVLHLAQEQAAEHGQACLVLDADGTLLYTAEPPISYTASRLFTTIDPTRRP